MSSFALGPLSNRQPQYQQQNSLIVDSNGRLRFAALSRRVLALPPEILSEIFVHCLSDAEFITPDPTIAPLVLCGICSQWRMIALTTPALWNSLLLDTPSANREGYTDLCQSWLSRARKTSLSLCLRTSDEATVLPSVSPSLHSLLLAIVALAPQWRNIQLDLEGDLAELMLPPEGHYPLLEKFKIAGFRGAVGLPASFRNAPKLHEFFALGIYQNRWHMQIPWQHITTFGTHQISLTACLEILRDASNLVDGSFELLDEHSSALERITIPPLVHLHSLSLSGISIRNGNALFMTILSFLKTPALQSLTLKFPSSFWTDTLTITPFLSFVSKSSFQLQTLVISLMPTTTETLIECLKAIPSLVHLKLEPAHIVDMNTILAQFTGHSDFLPKLESLHLLFTGHSSSVHAITVSGLIEMLCWRWASVGITRLKSFQLAHAHRESVFDEAAKFHSDFRRLKEEGMDLYVGKERLHVDSFSVWSIYR
ncbi:hypothetical protein C8R43DRAFT_1015575 [Mycena crocata]|nr:hypothetical protein C8R43DRAFT_1015575 [Mycena crocata]